MNGHIEALVGFDARESFAKFQDVWDAKRINQYLLRDDVIKPLSVDVMVWDSVLNALQVPLPGWVGPRQAWDSLQRLRIFMTKKNVRASYWIIGISQWMPIDAKDVFEKLNNSKSPSILPEWSLLGYDIADASLLSGLMNAGYLTEEYTTLKQDWRQHLNQYHLFRDWDIAFRFKTLTDERVKEHSPFSVYGIYLIETVTGIESVSTPK